MTSCSNTNIFGKWVSEGYILSESENGLTTGKNLISLFGKTNFSAEILSSLSSSKTNDDPTRVKAENKCKSTGWTVKSRPHQIVEVQSFLILVLIKWYNSFFDSGLFHLSERYFWLWSIHLHLFSIKCVIVFVTAKVICKCWLEFSKNSSAISWYHFNWLSGNDGILCHFLEEFKMAFAKWLWL